MTEKKKVSEMADRKKIEDIKEVETKFLKEQLISCEQFKEKRDILNALLEKGKQYTVKEAKGKIENYMKGEVK